MSTLFKKLGKEIQEAQSKLATALYPKTSDTEFDTKRNELTRSQKNIKKLRKNVDLIVMTAEAQHVAQTRMCENLSRIANQGSLVIANCNAFDTKLDEAFKAMDTKRTEIQIAIDSYMEQYNELEKRIAERFNRLAQMDRADKDLKKAEHHKPTRTEEYRNSYIYWKDSFEALNQEIKRDISLLVQDAANFVEKIYPVIAAAQVGYFTDCVNGTQVLHAVTSKADLESVKSAPRVITPNASSAMYFHGRGQLPSTSLQTMPSTQVSSTAPPLPPHPQPVATATALYDFQSTNPNELSFKAGDKLNLISHEGPWWKAQLEGKEGNVPSNFLQIISS